MADLLRLHTANNKCKRFIGAYHDLPDDWEARNRYIKPMFTKNPPPFLTDDEVTDYVYQYGKMVNALNIVNPKRSQLDNASRARLSMWDAWFESRSRWESCGHAEPDFGCNDGLRAYFSGAAMSIGETRVAAVDTENNAGGSAYTAAGGVDAEEMEDGFASAEMDDTSDYPCELREWTENEDEEEAGFDEMMAAGMESGYETALTDREGEMEGEEMGKMGVEGEKEVDVYSIRFTPINGPGNPYEWKPCCPSSCILCFEHELVTKDTVLDE